jgi:uncharacterized small protein (DUF1192 family)
MIELTIKRPNGEIEKVQREGGMTKIMFEKMQEATRNAGRGEILSWEQVDTRTDEEKSAHALNDKIAKTEIALAKARELDPQEACKLRDELENLKAQRKG